MANAAEKQRGMSIIPVACGFAYVTKFRRIKRDEKHTMHNISALDPISSKLLLVVFSLCKQNIWISQDSFTYKPKSPYDVASCGTF
mmetsp:Transcript_45786/g.74698  ORF Transcript_45786/g.74698 Transcript_45786/m.74698 type:complete len:86 (-) Transcript_45786:1784-2041(-)